MRNRGIAYFIILGVLVVLLAFAFMISRMSVNERRAAKTSLDDVKIHCLLLSGLRLAMREFVKEGNDFENYMKLGAGKEKHLYYLLRKPMKNSVPAVLTGNSNLGLDNALGTGSPTPLIREFSSDVIDLQPIIDEIGGTILELKVSVLYDEESQKPAVYSVDPKNSAHSTLDITKERFVNPGLDGLWTNGELPSVDLGFPPFEISLDVKLPFHGLKIPVPLTPLLKASGLLDALGIGTGNKLDLNVLFNPVFKLMGFQLPFTVPIKVAPEGKPFPTPDRHYPQGTLPTDYQTAFSEYHLEKYGTLFLKAEIKYRTEAGKVHSATATGKTPFHVSDVQPVASMYSFFVNNTLDRRICFNGGFADPFDSSKSQTVIEPEDELLGSSKQHYPQFYVNNMSFNFFKNIVTNQYSASADPVKYNMEFEIPGLIRVNGTKEHVVNVPWFGGRDESGQRNPCRNLGLPLLIRENIHKFKVSKKYSDTTFAIGSMYPLFPTPKDAIKGLKEFFFSGFGALPKFLIDVARKGFKEALMEFIKKMLQPKCGWDWPWSVKGIFLLTEKFDYYMIAVPRVSDELPVIPFTAAPTHLFGEYSIFPTLTREIEGNVKKRWINWAGQILVNDIFGPPIPAMYFHNTEERDWYQYSWAVTCPPDQAITSDSSLPTYVEFKPTEPDKQVPGLYEFYQYVKKASRYYSSYADFAIDARNRIDPRDGCYVLEGIVFVKCLPKNDPDFCPLFLGGFKASADPHGNFTRFEPGDADLRKTSVSNRPDPRFCSPLKIKGKGMFVTDGDIVILDSILQKKDEGNPDTTLDTTLSIVAISPEPASSADQWPIIMVGKGGNKWGAEVPRVEASVYSQGGVITDGNVIIHGNLVCDNFSTAYLRSGTDDEFLEVQFDTRETKTSLASIHPTMGKYDFRRYYVTLGEYLDDYQTWKH